MAVRQLSIFLENRKGRLEAITRILADNNIDIRGLAVADTAEFGILRLIVDDTDSAEKCLRAQDVVLHLNDVTAVKVNRAPGGLLKLLSALNDTQINVEYMYNLALPLGEDPVIILRFSEPHAAREILRKAGCVLLDETDLGVKG